MAKKDKQKNRTICLELASLVDLARYCYKFDFTYDTIFQDSNNGSTLLYCFGDHIDDANIVYYFKPDNLVNMLEYKPPENGEKETVYTLNLPDDLRNSRTDVLTMSLPELWSKDKVKPPKTKILEMGSLKDLIKLAIKGSKEGQMEGLFCFESGSSNVFFGIDLINTHHDADPIIYYAKEKKTIKPSFAVYDYKKATATLTDAVGEHSLMYLKVINLVSKPPFFTANV